MRKFHFESPVNLRSTRNLWPIKSLNMLQVSLCEMSLLYNYQYRSIAQFSSGEIHRHKYRKTCTLKKHLQYSIDDIVYTFFYE
jgi:hypothetical protein